MDKATSRGWLLTIREHRHYCVSKIRVKTSWAMQQDRHHSVGHPTNIRTVRHTKEVDPSLPTSQGVILVADRSNPDDRIILIDVTNGDLVLQLPASLMVKNREFVFRRLDNLTNSERPSLKFEATIELSAAEDFIDFPEYATKVRLKAPNTGIRLAADPDGGDKIIAILGPNRKLAFNHVVEI